MALISGCLLPDDLHYFIEKHIWVKALADDLVRLGLTTVALKLSGTLTAFTPKEAGREIQKGKSIATLESSKWVGPVPSPLSGLLLRTNSALVQDPSLINRDPYGEGWIAELRPKDLEELKELPTGEEGISQYRAWLEKEGIACP